jgi:hypothetical protein
MGIRNSPKTAKKSCPTHGFLLILIWEKMQAVCVTVERTAGSHLLVSRSLFRRFCTFSLCVTNLRARGKEFGVSSRHSKSNGKCRPQLIASQHYYRNRLQRYHTLIGRENAERVAGHCTANSSSPISSFSHTSTTSHRPQGHYKA